MARKLKLIPKGAENSKGYDFEIKFNPEAGANCLVKYRAQVYVSQLSDWCLEKFTHQYVCNPGPLHKGNRELFCLLACLEKPCRYYPYLFRHNLFFLCASFPSNCPARDLIIYQTGARTMQMLLSLFSQVASSPSREKSLHK